MNWILQFRFQKSTIPSLLIPTPCVTQSLLEQVRPYWGLICWKSWKSFSRTPPTQHRPFWSPWKVSAGEYSGSAYTNISVFAPSRLHKLLLKYQLWSSKTLSFLFENVLKQLYEGAFFVYAKKKKNLFSSYFSLVAYSYITVPLPTESKEKKQQTSTEKEKKNHQAIISVRNSIYCGIVVKSYNALKPTTGWNMYSISYQAWAENNLREDVS